MNRVPAELGDGRVPVVMYGFGRVGRATAELALTRPWIDLRGVIARSPASDGLRVADVVGDAPDDLRVSIDPAATIAEARPEVVLVATSSTLPEILPQLELATAGGAAVICTAEELAYIEPGDGPEAAAIHELARRNRVAILAAGINPGFVLDLWPLVASGVAWDVAAIHARRIVDVSVFGPTVRAKLGIGYSAEGFRARVAQGSVVGHLGFRESLRAISAGMGRSIDRISLDIEPIVSDGPIGRDGVDLRPGHTAGVLQRAVAIVDGRPWITIDLIVHVDPHSAGLDPTDELRIEGRHPVEVVVRGGYPAVLSTAALLVNAIPTALAARPGVHASGDLPPSRPWLARERGDWSMR